MLRRGPFLSNALCAARRSKKDLPPTMPGSKFVDFKKTRERWSNMEAVGIESSIGLMSRRHKKKSSPFSGADEKSMMILVGLATAECFISFYFCSPQMSVILNAATIPSLMVASQYLKYDRLSEFSLFFILGGFFLTFFSLTISSYVGATLIWLLSLFYITSEFFFS